MDKNLTWKIVLIIVLVVLAVVSLYPPDKTLKPGMDLGGGTSLIYEIDAQGLSSQEKRGLSEKMITVLRRRIDPANIQNLVWRPQGNTRFEIQMPLASAEARAKRGAFEKTLNLLLADNVNPAVIMRALSRPAEERAQYFETVARDSNERDEILNNLASVYDARKELQGKRDELKAQLGVPENLINLAGLDLEMIKSQLGEWMKLSDEQLKESLLEFLGSEGNVELLTRYTRMYGEWADVVDQLTEPETGKNIEYKQARAALNRLNLSEDQVNLVLEMDEPGSLQRAQRKEEMEDYFQERAAKIDAVVAAYDEYYPFRGRLDDAADIQRMLKGAGILEFRILPTLGHPEVDSDQMGVYVETLREKGPKYASDTMYVWCEVENAEEWLGRGADGQVYAKQTDKEGRPAIVAQFGDKLYVLAGNRQQESMLHTGESKDWKLERSSSGQDQYGRRAINFTLDERGGYLFANVTGKNIDRPLCILLDGIAISAPTINTRIYMRGQITGSFTPTQVDDMVSKLNAGSLPAMLIEQPISIKTIGPSIGADNRDKGVKAGLIGLAVVVGCMLVYYILAGTIADVALLMNILFVLAIMAGLRATFTLPGIAGIILTIGMSVDANVLIFERIREEQRKGSSLGVSIRNGYQRALRTILDANLTTFITAAILFWVASEEIKGFAIVLMLGIISSMFTALFVTRVIFEWLLSKRMIKDHLFMLSIIHKPSVDWMKLRPVFLAISTVFITGGLLVFFTRDDVKNNKYDIEFTGGTSVQISLKEASTRGEVEEKFRTVAAELGNPALATANIYSVGKSNRQFEITTTETNKLVTTVKFTESSGQTTESVTAGIRKAQRGQEGRLSNLTVSEEGTGGFVIATSQLNKSVVKGILSSAFAEAQITEPQIDEVVNNAILGAFSDELEIQQDLEPTIVSNEKITEAAIESYPELADFLGGVKVTCELGRGASLDEISARLADLRFKPDMQSLAWYPYKLFDGSMAEADRNKKLSSFVIVSALPEAGYRELSEDEWQRFVENETQRVLAATRLETSLPRVTQISPSIGGEAKTRALIAIVLSLFAIVAYIWVRFGNVRYGIAAIVALVHDVCITLGAVTVCTYITTTWIGEMFLIGDFKINLAIIAAFLTLIGYSLNDTIVVFDRIRENRKKAQLKAQTISDSINQTLSRTILTSFTTFIVVLIMYIFGGDGLRGFTFAIGFGVIIGTYSSIAIAAPILLLGTKSKMGSGK